MVNYLLSREDWALKALNTQGSQAILGEPKMLWFWLWVLTAAPAEGALPKTLLASRVQDLSPMFMNTTSFPAPRGKVIYSLADFNSS